MVSNVSPPPPSPPTHKIHTVVRTTRSMVSNVSPPPPPSPPTHKIRTVVAGDPFHGVQRVPQPLLPVQHVPRRVDLAGPRAVLGGPGDPSFRRPLVPLVLSRQHASGDMGQRPWRGFFSLFFLATPFLSPPPPLSTPPPPPRSFLSPLLIFSVLFFSPFLLLFRFYFMGICGVSGGADGGVGGWVGSVRTLHVR